MARICELLVEDHQQPFRLRFFGSGAPSFLGRGIMCVGCTGGSSGRAAVGSGLQQADTLESKSVADAGAWTGGGC